VVGATKMHFLQNQNVLFSLYFSVYCTVLLLCKGKKNRKTVVLLIIIDNSVRLDGHFWEDRILSLLYLAAVVYYQLPITVAALSKA
jgi:hypothetical protein